MNIRMWGSGRFFEVKLSVLLPKTVGVWSVSSVLSKSETRFKEKQCLTFSDLQGLVLSLTIYKIYPLNIFQGLPFSDNV